MSIGHKAVLMRLSMGMPGKNRQDKKTTSEVKAEKHLGDKSGKWVKDLYPTEALKPIGAVQHEAGQFHRALTVPFDDGIGILPTLLIPEYCERMREFKGRIAHLVDSHFFAKAQEWVDWASGQHNGTFDPSLYPGCSAEPVGSHYDVKLEKNVDDYVLDVAMFKAKLAGKFYFRNDPIPVPESTHYEDTVKSLLGVDTLSIDQRVADAEREGQLLLLKRMIEPVQNMVEVLSSDEPRIFQTLVGNVDEICRLAPALNLAGDPAIDAFVVEMKKLTTFKADDLKQNPMARKATAIAAEEIAKRLSGYKF